MKKIKPTIDGLTFALGFVIGCMAGMLALLAIMIYVTLNYY